MSFKILSWNVNGIRAAVGHGFVDFLRDEQPSILALQEIKIDDAKRAQANFDFAGYQEFWCPAKKAGYSGTALLIKDGLKPLKVTNGLGEARFDDEGRVQTAEFAKFFLVNLYFPNAQPELKRLAYKEAFNAAVLKYWQKLAKTKPVIACGDFNVAHEAIDLARPKENVGNPGFSDEERAWADKFLAAGFIDSFRALHPQSVQYSWWSYRMNARAKNIGWRIDYFWLSAKLKKHLKKAFILDKITGSDHCPVGIEIEA